jgi:hypothetical protein
MTTFFEAVSFSGHAPYAVWPSLLVRLPETGDVYIPDQFLADPENYRFQFLSANFPNHILRFSVESETPVKFHPWSIALKGAWEDLTFENLSAHFRKSFCVEIESVTFDFSNPTVNTSTPISKQLEAIKYSTVVLRIAIADPHVSRLKHRIEILKELIQTERSYVDCLSKTAEHFTGEFFARMDIDPDVFRRTFKSVSEIKPIHETFLQAIESVGATPESSIGVTFVEYIPYFKVAAPHVANFSSTNAEFNELLKSNAILRKAVQQLLIDFFDGGTVEALLVNPVQRIPRYPLLLRDLLKYTSENHWDYEALSGACDGIKKLNQEIDQRTREQADFKALRSLQERFGQAYQVVSSGRRLIG